MRDIPFNVSARTARLIGRENVSSAEGALIELVKNSYDADAKFCVVYFDDSYSELPSALQEEELERFGKILKNNEIDFIENYYVVDAETGLLRFQKEEYELEIPKEQRALVDKKLLSSVELHIIDNGDGMAEETIEKSWMTIGTDNKDIEFISVATGRVKSGAKGIGRFALDRLGEQCDLLTKTKLTDDTLLWKVNWGDFDKRGININGVSAQLGVTTTSLTDSIFQLMEEVDVASLGAHHNQGTHINISQVRDSWKYADIAKIFAELESLVPPVEAGDFKVYVYSKRYSSDFGEVTPSACEDYDFKLSAKMDSSGVIEFEVIRHELDQNRLPDELLQRPFFSNARFSRPKLCGEAFKYKKTLYELIPGLGDIDNEAHVLVGSFRFTLYFLKRMTDKKDTEVFRHRTFDSENRKRWLDNNNGIRIFRDNFRVRPYGEIGKASWDWLGLGRRKTEDPSSLRTGRWKVAPNNVSGVINISRISNLGLADKSSREGIQETTTFGLFRSIIEALIKEFEQDRSSIYKEVYNFYIEKQNTPTDQELNPKQEEDAEKLAQKIFDNVKKEQKEAEDDSTKLALALLKEKARGREIDDRLEEMKKENSLLRVFASSGITIASFTHELDGLNAKLGNRFDQLEALVRSYVNLTVDERTHLQEFKNPYKRISILKRDDERVKNWIKYSLRTIRKDKRKRVKINIKNYLENLREEWSSTLAERQVQLLVTVDDPNLAVRAYEIDLDCIFNNLIINSADAFKRPGFSGARQITIEAVSKSKRIRLNYLDSGPGLSKDIVDPKDIFKPTFTTKKNSHGEEIGTGLGMWLIEKTIEEYGGSIALGSNQGFGISMEIKSE